MSVRLNRLFGPRVALLVVLVAGLALYLPGINGPFLFDDHHNFLQNPFVQMTELDRDGVLDAVFSAGGHFPDRGMSRLSFALNYYFSGGVFDARVFKLTNLVIHLLNAVLVFALARALFGQYQHRHPGQAQRVMWMALLCAGVWLVHPMQLTSVLYAVQRMTSLSALFVFIGLLVYVHGRRQVQHGDQRGFVLMAIGIGAGTVLGVLNKENAALLPFLAFVVHLAFFPSAALDASLRRRLGLFHALFVGTAAVLAVGAVVWSWSAIVSSFENGRDFTMAERLLTQPRVLFLYLSLFLFPSLRRMSLHHDDFVVSAGLLDPPTTLLAIVLLVCLLAFAIHRLRSGACWAFAVVFFLVAHSMESSFLSLEMVYEHRNYLPSFALAMLVSHALIAFTGATGRPVLLASVVGVALVSGLGVVTWARAGIWSNEALLMRYMTAQHPDSYRALALAARGKSAEGGTVSDIFVAYARIAQANKTAIFPLIRMRRVVNAMQFQLKEGIMQPTAPAAPVAMENAGWDAPALYLDERYLVKVAAALDAEIKRRLPLSPIHNETLSEFREVRSCIEAQLDLCIGLDDEFQGWLRVALQDSKMDAEARRRILDQLAWQQERAGAFDLAHASLREAGENGSAGLPYRLRRVLLFVRQRDFTAAERLLQQIESSKGSTRIDRRGIQRTREHLDRLREDEPSGQVPSSGSRQ